MSLPIEWGSSFYQPVHSGPEHIEVGAVRVERTAHLDCGAPLGHIRAGDLADALARYERLTAGACRPQLAALAFYVTRQTSALDTYFPLTRGLDAGERRAFYGLAKDILLRPTFDVRIYGAQRRDVTDQFPEAAYLVAGHIAELFFYRQDILDALLRTPRHIWFYTTPEAFAKDGGIAAGCFNPQRGCLQLVLSRLYEGFNAKTPGVLPFLHEFGHLLDHADVGHSGPGAATGLYPGLRPADGPIYSPQARDLFLQGKRLELERYLRLCDGAPPTDPLPIGHPYVFQNDGEFAAGYLEMFFRNPHYFAAQNPTLYEGYQRLFQQDPRQFWPQDFPFYVQQNRSFYQSGQRPARPGLTV